MGVVMRVAYTDLVIATSSNQQGQGNEREGGKCVQYGTLVLG